MHPDMEAYLNGELQGEALERFEVMLATDAALREEAELLRPVLRDLRLVAIERRVTEAERNHATRWRPWWVWVLLGSVLLGGGIVWRRWGHPLNRQPVPVMQPSLASGPDSVELSPQENILPINGKPVAAITANKNADLRQLILKKYYEVPIVLLAERSATDSSIDAQILYFFQQKKYIDAIQRLNRTDSTDLPTDYIRAHIYFAQKRYPEAVQYFERMGKKNPDYRDVCQWYALLSALVADPSDLKTARRLDNTMKNDTDHLFRDRVAQLRKDYNW